MNYFILFLSCFPLLMGTGCTREKPVKISTIQISNNSKVSYSIFLPQNFSPTKSYSLLVCLSPGGNGRNYLSHLQKLSKHVDWIVVGSNNYRNNLSHKSFLPAMKQTISHVQKKYKIKGVYLAGLSGGGMATYVCAYFRPRFYKGLIVNNGAIHQNLLEPGKLSRMGVQKVALLGSSKDTVVTLSRLKQDENRLKSNGIKTKLFTFEGGHQLAPVETYMQALKFVE